MNEHDSESLPDSTSDLAIAPRLSLDTVLEVLANHDRRFAVYSLMTNGTRVMGLDSLIEEVVTLDAANAHTPVTGERYRAIARDLVHWHLPVLVDVGVIEWDERSEEIRYWADATLETWADRLRRDELRAT